MKIFFAVLLFLAAFVCAVLCTKTRIMLEYKNGNLKITLRNLFFKYTFDQSKKRMADPESEQQKRSDDLPNGADADEKKADAGNGAAAESENADNAEGTVSGEALRNEKDESISENDSDTDTAEGLLERLRQLKSMYHLYKNTADAFLVALRGKIEIYGIRLGIAYGTGNAAHTGMLYGAFWSVLGGIYPFLCRFFSVEFPKMSIQPDFNQKRLETEMEGIIAARLVHIIIAVFKAYKVYKRDSGRGIFDIIKEQSTKRKAAERE